MASVCLALALAAGCAIKTLLFSLTGLAIVPFCYY